MFTHVMLHHSLTTDSGTVSWGAIRRYHVDELGWADIGYHAGIELVVDRYEVLIGRLWDRDGAHCHQGGMNRAAFGLCLVGNFDLAPPPPEQWDLAVRFVRWLASAYVVCPASRIVGHRDYAPKSCPGAQFDLARFREDVAGTMPGRLYA